MQLKLLSLEEAGAAVFAIHGRLGEGAVERGRLLSVIVIRLLVNILVEDAHRTQESDILR